MDWNPAYSWLVIALLLGLAELTSGAMLLLALGVAAAFTAAVAAIGLSLPWQLISMGIFSGLFVPLGIMVIRPRFSPKGVAYGTTGTGVEKGQRYKILRRDFDNASGIKVNGDFYRIRVIESGDTELPPDTFVKFKRFEGTTALVELYPSKDPDPQKATSPSKE